MKGDEVGMKSKGNSGTEVNSVKRKMTLPTDSAERKEYPLLSGFLKYFPAAIAGVANLSKIGNDKHNPGQPLHHARGKSTDHGDCIVRHLMDLEDLQAAKERGVLVTEQQILLEASSLVWRALAYSQELHEKYGAPLAPAAKLDEQVPAAPPKFSQPETKQTITTSGIVNLNITDWLKIQKLEKEIMCEPGNMCIVCERIIKEIETIKNGGQIA